MKIIALCFHFDTYTSTCTDTYTNARNNALAGAIPCPGTDTRADRRPGTYTYTNADTNTSTNTGSQMVQAIRS